MEVVVERMALSQELGREDNLLIPRLLTQLSRIAYRNRRLDDNPAIRVIFTNRLDGGLNAGGIEVVLLRIIVRWRGHHSVIRSRVSNSWIERGLKIKIHRAVAHAIEETSDLGIDNRALAIVEQFDLLGNDIERMHLIMLRQQQRNRQSYITSSSNGNLHSSSIFYVVNMLLH